MECSQLGVEVAVFVAVVLNALRHQWNVHTTWMLDPGPARMCSTPYGVNGMFTVYIVDNTTDKY